MRSAARHHEHVPASAPTPAATPASAAAPASAAPLSRLHAARRALHSAIAASQQPEVSSSSSILNSTQAKGFPVRHDRTSCELMQDTVMWQRSPAR